MNEFELKVKNMRRLQKLYFATRSSATLAECKEAEKEVDNMLWLKEHESPRQMELFGESTRQIDVFGFDGDDK